MSTDLKYALRLLAKSPWFTSLTVLVLAGGLAISVYTYAALSTIFYRDLPLPDSGSIVRIAYGGFPNVRPLDAFELAGLRAQARSVEELGVYRDSRALVGEPGASRSVLAVESDWRIFEFTRVQPVLGRGFVRDDAARGAEPVAVLGFGTWQSAFAADASVVGTLATINGRPTRIVGVMPDGYGFPMNKSIWLPLPADDLEPAGYSGMMFDAYARLRPGVSVETAQAELTALVERIRRAQPEPDERTREPVSIGSLQAASFGVFGDVVFGVLNSLALAILLLAAVNIGNLLLARTNARMNEIGVRIALGAPRARLIAQTALENVVLCALGGTLAIFLAARTLEATSGFMRSLLGSVMPFWWQWGLDAELVLVTGLLLVSTVVVVSVLPTLSVTRADPNALLKDGPRAGRGLETGRISRTLVTVQVALISAVMLVGSVATLIAGRMTDFDFGMDTANLYMMGVEFPEGRYATAAERSSFTDRLLAELRATPGIDAARVMRDSGIGPFSVTGADYAAPDERPLAWLVVLSESPVQIGPPLLEGRMFDSRDDAAGLKTALVSRKLAREQWPDQSPLGETIDVAVAGAAPEQRVIVGVVGDVVFDPVGLTAAGNSAVYVPLPQSPPLSARMIVRHFGEEAVAHGALYEALARVDPTIAPNVQTYDTALESATRFARAVAKLFAGCGVFAILLAITGIYGMSSNAVVLRRHEIGLRRTLGATNRGIIALFMKQSARQLTIGLSVSALLSMVVLAVIRQSFAIGAGELASIGFGVVLVISATVLVSVYLSVRSSIRLDPSSALRQG
ncbi:MAG TPA: ABC transporter permease [Gammaproteobacteria bacterium]|nr:ABC transporter permease [Gammaproteobacteria bacterium]